MKKELDLKTILQKSIHEAKKAHGLLEAKEEDQKKPKISLSSFARAETSKEAGLKRMPSVQLEQKTWGKQGSVEGSAQALEVYMAPLRDNKKPSTPAEFKTFLSRLNKALGVKTGAEGEIQYDITISDAKLPEIVSGLVIRQALHSLVWHNKATTAGDIWEGFVARMLGRNVSSGNPIEDIEGEDVQGYRTSLKLVQPDTKIVGSIANLAKALANPKVNGVQYVVGVKTKENDPFRVKFYSFEVKKDNFFHFIYGKPGVDVGWIKKTIESWNTTHKLGLTAATSKQAISSTSQQAPDFQDLINVDKTNIEGDKEYFDYIFKRAKDPYLMAAANDLHNTVDALTGEDKTLLTNYLKSNEAIAKRLKAGKTDDVADAFFKSGNLSKLEPDIFKSPMHTAIQNLLRNYSEESDDAQLKRLKDVLKALDSINIIFREKKKDLQSKIRQHVVGQETQTTPADIKILVSSFWNIMSTHPVQLKLGQFEVEQNFLRNIHHIEIDDEYEPIYLEPEKLFASAQNIANLFETYAQPIYDDHYRADLAIRKYFVEDEPSGMKDLEIILKETVEDINELRGGATGDFKKASDLKENKNHFKNPTIDDILDEL